LLGLQRQVRCPSDWALFCYVHPTEAMADGNDLEKAAGHGSNQ
jgi:hypothetical protein